MTVSINGTTGLTFNDASTQATAATGFGFKNRLINGAMMIDQRNAGAEITPTNTQFSLDRWQAIMAQSSKFTLLQSSLAPTGFVNSLRVTSSSAYTVGSSEFFFIRQRIEGLNVADLGWGTASASTVTLSFWVRSSLTGTFGGSFRNSDATRTYPFSYTISVANTWEQKIVTVAGDTSGTWLTTNGVGIELDFTLGAGSTFQGTANTWSGSNYLAPTGSTSVVGTNGATFYITGVQLEKGSTATSFDYRPYGTELQLCQRYYEKYSSSGETFGLPTAYVYNGAAIYGRQFYQVEKRAAPTITFSSTGNTLLECYATGAGSGLSYSGTIAAEIVNAKSFAWNQPVSGISGGVAVMAGIRSGQSFQISAEL
jgi:hypothetical protein